MPRAPDSETDLWAEDEAPTRASEGDANAPLRHPLTVLCILAPLGVIAELYRFLSREKARLLTEDQWSELGAVLGLDAPLVPILVLVVGALAVQIVSRKSWTMPTLTTLILIAGWAAIWAVVRYTVGFTAESMSGGAALSEDAIHRLSVLGQIGLAFSGALQEELVFRAGLLGGLCLLLRGVGGGSTLAALIALPASAALFSLAHTDIINHYGAAETFTWSSFAHRFAAGMLYGWIFLRQGLAVATLAHAGYNVAILFKLGPWL